MTSFRTTGAPLTLFHVAASRLGDPLNWWQVANASGVVDPWLPAGLLVLTVPAATDANGGVPPQ